MKMMMAKIADVKGIQPETATEWVGWGGTDLGMQAASAVNQKLSQVGGDIKSLYNYVAGSVGMSFGRRKNVSKVSSKKSVKSSKKSPKYNKKSLKRSKKSPKYRS